GDIEIPISTARTGSRGEQSPFVGRRRVIEPRLRHRIEEEILLIAAGAGRLAGARGTREYPRQAGAAGDADRIGPAHRVVPERMAVHCRGVPTAVRAVGRYSNRAIENCAGSRGGYSADGAGADEAVPIFRR